MNALIGATVAIIYMFPPGPHAVFRQSPPRHIIEFNEPIVSYNIEILDNDGCKISESSSIENQTKLIVTLKACDKIGFPSGAMSIKWTVNGASGQYELHIRHHH